MDITGIIALLNHNEMKNYILQPNKAQVILAKPSFQHSLEGSLATINLNDDLDEIQTEIDDL